MAERDQEGSSWNIAKWIYDQEVENIKENLVIKGDSGGVTSADVISYGLEDVEELKGAAGSARVSLNPADWTAKELKKTLLSRPWGSITDWDEYRQSAKGAVWEDLTTGYSDVGGDNPDRYELYDRDAKRVRDVRGKSLLERVAVRDASRFPDAVYDSNDKQYYVYGRNTPASPRVEDSYEDVASAATAYMQKSVTSDRNAAFHGLNVEAIKAWNEELKGIDPSSHPTLSADDRLRLLNFNQALAEKNEALRAADSFSQTIDKLLENNDKKVFIKDLKAYDKDLGRKVDYRNRLDGTFKLTKGRLADLDPEGQKEAAKLISFMDGLEKQLYDGSGNLIADDKKIFSILKVQNDRLHRKTIDTGVLGDFSKNAVNGLKNNKDFKNLVGLEYYDAAGNRQRLVSKSGQNLLNVMNAAHKDWNWEATNDYITDIFEGKLPRQILWDRAIAPRIERYTPSYWIGRGVKSVAKATGITKALGKYEALWTNLQKKTIGKWMGAAQYQIQLLKQRIGDAIEQLISKYVGGALAVETAGISLVVAKVVGKIARIIAQVVVNRIVDVGARAWEKIKKFDFSALDDVVSGAVKAALVVAGSCLAVVGTLIMFVILLVGGILSAFGWDDTTKVATDLSDRIIYEEGLYAFGSYDAENCPVDDALDLTFPRTSQSGAANRAYDLVTDLLRGFWCYWNHSPEFDSANDQDDLFDEIQFAANSFPGTLNNCADCLFWCTWLPYIAYNSSFDPEIKYLGAQRMYEYFKASQTFIDPTEAGSASNVRSGDIVFFQTGSGTGWHVAMVYYVNEDVVMTIHSNAPYKELPLTVASNGSVQSPQDFPIRVVGFGRPGPSVRVRVPIQQ